MSQAALQVSAESAAAAEARVLADFLSSTRDKELEDIAFKRRRGYLGLAVAILLGIVSWRLQKEIKVVTEASVLLLGVFMASPLIVGVRANLVRVDAYEALRKLLMMPGADADAIQQARQFLKTALVGSTK